MQTETTNWDSYYDRPYKTASLTRRYTWSVLRHLILRSAAPTSKLGTLVELGGANSCFYDSLTAAFNPDHYHVFDLNPKGLELLRQRQHHDPRLHVHHGDILNLDLQLQADLVFSVGLIEHFDPPATRKAIENHFALCKPGGFVLLTFPTPTWLYRATRTVAEATRNWIFPDERPLLRDEVAPTVQRFGTILAERITWPIFLTQYVLLVQKSPEN